MSLRLLPPLTPNCADASRPESETVAHDWREIGSDAVQQYDQCVRCGIIATADEGSDLLEEIDEIAALVVAAEQRGAAAERERISRQSLDRRDLMRHRSGGRHGNPAYADGYAMGVTDAAHIAHGWDGLPSPPSAEEPS